eukprot:CAMPEP_0198708028 /NCGR_PEP_ID=MMETSP1471-20131121/811_1 /TAXON_ID=41880 /ORGANISM="Pycnococcus provasolii, Strain RCC733" /LENGTH=375 /DNA_ID=CAMNT_0044467209 /DNA_START=38 /DNA_END=1165 /DNA_ORIENTATION=-
MTISEFVSENAVPLTIAAAGVSLAGVYALRSRDGMRSVPRATDLGGGGGKAIKEGEVEGHWNAYDNYFTQADGAVQSGDKTKAPTFVNTFYNLVTDIYEWGWGQSFHFSPPVKGKSHKAAEEMHEHYISDCAGLKKGMKALDIGCGVGGPMRVIARHSGANVTGITINDYQVQRCRSHNKRAGLDKQCEVVQGNFLEMPFEDNSFDGCYAVEATCHAPAIKDVYKEAYRVLKPGGYFATYEWVTTPMFDKNNKRHVEIIEGINHGNALPDMRTYTEVEEAAKEVGFKVLRTADLALKPHPGYTTHGNWYDRIKIGKAEYNRNDVVVRILQFLGVAPKGTKEVHRMLVDVTYDLSAGGETGIFTPMHLVVCQKPLK